MSPKILKTWSELTNPKQPLTSDRLQLIFLFSILASIILVLADLTWHHYHVQSWAASSEAEIYARLINTYLDIKRDGFLHWAGNLCLRCCVLFWGLLGVRFKSSVQFAEVVVEYEEEVLSDGDEEEEEGEGEALSEEDEDMDTLWVKITLREHMYGN
ncbi:predicted protein [Sclerotinia sclerotiorum 1980 UF-70]|uniref:Uncharacterized protein n=2 Tax=Sclerotinia sclerotiorum (strain ATCC 18683 / 1980 / Ss-1) TaxID=665079 RepID=A7F5H7_SCLS1|nr:predicted protein [Sclerotinia sclerotiorum 1980 UF-70]APA06466.1 hypothetical protein sscle_02g012360 [Sclerotinia sclerotiorum 1980 UF-70]EDN97998.1 predicted protein [Sclerotinia sclerotiorum 1980 UF-70]